MSVEKQLKRTLLFGANPEVEDALLRSGCDNLLVFDDRLKKSLRPCVPWARGLEAVLNNTPTHFFLVCGVASTPVQRAQAIQLIERKLHGATNWAWTNVRAATANVSPSAKLGTGVLVLDNCYVGPLTQLHDHCVMLPAAKLYHHGVLERYSILVGGSTSLGHAHIREGSRVCGNAVVFPHADVGPGETVAALTPAPAKKNEARKFFEEFGREPE